MLRQGGGDVQVNQGIAAQHQGGFIKEAAEVLDAAHAAGRSHGARQNVAVFANALVGVANLHAPAATVAKIFFNLVVVVSHVDHDFGDAVAGQVLDQVFHHRFAQNRHHRLGQVPCERAHAGALAGGQNHAFSHAGLHSLCSCGECRWGRAASGRLVAPGVGSLPTPSVCTHAGQIQICLPV